MTEELVIPQSLKDQADAQIKALEQDPSMQMHEEEMVKAQPHMLSMISLRKKLHFLVAQLNLQWLSRRNGVGFKVSCMQLVLQVLQGLVITDAKAQPL